MKNDIKKVLFCGDKQIKNSEKNFKDIFENLDIKDLKIDFLDMSLDIDFLEKNSLDVLVLLPNLEDDTKKVENLEILLDKYLVEKDGLVFIYKDDKNYDKIRRVLRKYKNINVKKYGSSSSNNAYLQYLNSKENYHEIMAKVENKIVVYILGNSSFSVDDSLCLLLFFYHLDMDIHNLADTFSSLQKENISQSSILKILSKNSVFKTLRTLDLTDFEQFKTYVKNEKKLGAFYYFPFIYFWSQSSSRELLIDKKDDCLTLYLLNRFQRSSFPRLKLFLPVLPFIKKEQLNAFEKLYSYNGNKKIDITWIEQSDVAKLKSLDKRLKFKLKTKEFIYETKRYKNPTGGKFRTLRQQLNWFSKYEGIEIIPYETKYYEKCLELYTKWVDTRVGKYDRIEDEKYMKQTLLNFDIFDKKDLDGIIILDKQEVISFGFFGEITDENSLLFIAKSDYNYKGIQMFIKYKMLELSDKYLYSNDGGAENSKTLYFSKKKFNPIKYNNFYSVSI
jgi:hypothetical protein